MQSKKKSDLAKRSRYYQALMDTSLLEAGIPDYNLLNQTYLIVIMTFDLFGFGKYQYTFLPRCEEAPECRLNDGAVRIFLNTRGTNAAEVSKELVEFLAYLEETTDEAAVQAESERVRHIHERVCKVKSSEEIGVKYMQAWEEKYYDRQEAREEGLEEGRAEGREEGRKEVTTGAVQALIEICMEYNVSKAAAKQKIMEKLNLDERTTSEYLEKYWK